MLPKNKLYSLQVYRAIAALLVVFYHMGDQSIHKLNYRFLGNIFIFGYTGVDFFFVLSGFIILFVHSNDIGQPGRFVRYLKKRLVRIYPLYWLIVSIKVAALILLPTLAESSGNGFQYTLFSFLLIPQQELPIIGVAWTLSFEIFFYLFLGTAILFGRRWAIWSVSLWATLILLNAVGRFFHLPGIDHYLIQFVLNERNFEFILGLLIASHLHKSSLIKDQAWVIVGILLFIACGYYVYINNGEPPVTLSLTFGIASALIVAGSVAMENQKPIHWPRWLIYLGDASYSIYLTHALFINVWLIVFLRTGIASYIGHFYLTILVVALAIICGCLTFSVIEQPLMRMLYNRFLERRSARPFPTTLNATTNS